MKRVRVTNGHWAVKSPREGEAFSAFHGWEYIPQDGRWKFNGDYENPTFTPSMKETWKDPDGNRHCNHYNVTNGEIIFHGDSTHSRAGRTFPLVPLTAAEEALYFHPDGAPRENED